ncbi:superoxide dismutase family protein [Psychromarinibacter sp. C21-152]|uniref:Superoxide dismutase family protein n=1 Tax=Psychromarinibacter sediminicola TaxID=3033385 RepID=A0AAE3NT36_9RHOB|nr:superoxide dismutase family protein [Psychromarinibacter sediminicola]MDF0601572.1 superoxide dismutase family protein [Psychromarinibacter sediminicola]
MTHTDTTPPRPEASRAVAMARPAARPWPLLGGLMLATGLGAGLISAAAAQDTPQVDGHEIAFVAADGAEIGTATLTGTPVGLLIELDLHDLPPETWHGFHIHETGECDPEDGFRSAGGHFSVSDTEHGFLVPGGPHSGDMPNQYVAADGTLKAQVFTPYAFFGDAADNVSGRALVLHGGPDDYESQPSGAAGDRIACAVIE